MGNLLYLIAVILVIAWAIGFLGYHAGGKSFGALVKQDSGPPVPYLAA